MPNTPIKKDQLVDHLAADLRPVHRFSAGAVLALWLGIAWAFVCLVTFATGDLRPGVIEQLRQSPRFLVECVLGLVVGIAVFRNAILLSLPGVMSWKRAAIVTVGLLGVWVGVYVYGLANPALEPSMLGKRPHCFVETFAFSSVPLVLGYWLVSRRTPIARGWTGALIGAAAASLPATIMQIACMYDPKHILQFHLAPVAIVGIAGAIAGWLAFRKP